MATDRKYQFLLHGTARDPLSEDADALFNCMKLPSVES